MTTVLTPMTQLGLTELDVFSRSALTQIADGCHFAALRLQDLALDARQDGLFDLAERYRTDSNRFRNVHLAINLLYREAV